MNRTRPDRSVRWIRPVPVRVDDLIPVLVMADLFYEIVRRPATQRGANVDPSKVRSLSHPIVASNRVDCRRLPARGIRTLQRTRHV